MTLTSKESPPLIPLLHNILLCPYITISETLALYQIAEALGISGDSDGNIFTFYTETYLLQSS